MQVDSVLELPPGLIVVPTQLAVCVPVEFTVPEFGLCAHVPTNGMAQRKPVANVSKRASRIVRAEREEVVVFISGVS